MTNLEKAESLLNMLVESNPDHAERLLESMLAKIELRKRLATKRAQDEPVQSAARVDAYDMIDRFLRNNLRDDDYAEYSAALDSLYTAPQQAEPVQEPVAWQERQLINNITGRWTHWYECRPRMAHQPLEQLEPNGLMYQWRALYTAPPQRKPLTEPEYGSIDCVTFAGLPMTDGDRRLAAMLTQAFGADHPAIHDLVALLFAARGKQQAEPVQEPVAFDTAHAMRLADEYADLAADVRAAQGYPEHALAQDRKRMDEARASLEAYLSRQAEPVQIEHLPDGLAGWIPRYSVETPKGWVASYNKEALAWLAGSNYQDGRLTVNAAAAKQADAERDTLLNILLRARDAIEALDGTSVENEKLVDEYRAVIAKAEGGGNG